MHPKKIVKIVFCIVLLHSMMPNFTSLNAQVQSHQSTVIDYLSRMAQKGKIEFNDLIKPIDRKIIFQKLTELQNQKDLSAIEQKELQFFIAGFVLENPTIIHIGASLTDTSFGKNGNSGPQFFSFKKLKTNPTVQQNLITYKENGFGLIVNPMGNLTMQSRNGKINTIQGRGFQLAGYAGKRIGFQLSFIDINEQGRYDSLRLDNELPGFVKKGTTNPKILNYSQMNATLSYRLNKGMITVGQDQQVMGYGRSGNIVL